MSDRPVRARVPEFINNLEPYRHGGPVEEAAHGFPAASGVAPQRT